MEYLLEEIDTPYLILFALLFVAMLLGGTFLIIREAVKAGTSDLLKELKRRHKEPVS